MNHYSILTANPNFALVLAWVHEHNLEFELHLNRTRFWVPNGPLLTEFLLRFADSCMPVLDSEDLATGHKKSSTYRA